MKDLVQLTLVPCSTEQHQSQQSHLCTEAQVMVCYQHIEHISTAERDIIHTFLLGRLNDSDTRELFAWAAIIRPTIHRASADHNFCMGLYRAGAAVVAGIQNRVAR